MLQALVGTVLQYCAVVMSVGLSVRLSVHPHPQNALQYNTIQIEFVKRHNRSAEALVGWL